MTARSDEMVDSQVDLEVDSRARHMCAGIPAESLVHLTMPTPSATK
jgi:hypothetical protein